MHLNNYPASVNFGDCTYGTQAVAVQGATPGLLAGAFAGAQLGPSWLSADEILYQNGGTGAGPWILQSYDVTTPALSTEDANGQNFLAAGGGVWAAYLAGSGVRSNVVIGSPTAPLAGAFVSDVSVAGQIVLIDYQQTATGITVYSNAGASVYSDPTVSITCDGKVIRLQSNILAYRDTTGWHLRDVTTGLPPHWCPPLDEVNWIIPVTMADGSLWVVERTEQLRVRAALRNTAYVVAAAPIANNPDAIAFAAGVMRIGYCTDLGESLSSAVLVDVTLATGANQVGTVSGGTIVFAAGPTLETTTVLVGPNEAVGDLVMDPPFYEPMTRPGENITKPWKGWLSGFKRSVSQLRTDVTNLPKPPVPPPPSFGVVDPDTSGQVALTATVPTDTLTVTSGNNTITRATNPATNALDLRVNPFTLAGLGPRGVPGMDGEDGWPGPPGQTGPQGEPGESGSGSATEIGLTRQTGDGAEDTFNLTDIANYVFDVSAAGLTADPLTYTLSADGGSVTFDAPPGAGDVLTFEYVIATA